MNISNNKRLIFIIITMFLNFLGFSIIIPILPFLVQKYISDPNMIAFSVGSIMSMYALCQFFAAPGLGALSDRFGRRPILLFSLFGSVIGYLIMALGGSLWMLYLGRIIDGLTGGNISTVFAYIADITKPQERGKYYGLLGAAGGFGFMIGPAIGGLAASHIALVAPLYIAAGVTLLNMVWGYFILPESLIKEHRTNGLDLKHLNPFAQFQHILSLHVLRRLFLFGFLFFLALNAMQGNTSVFLKDVFHFDAGNIGLVLFAVGLIDIFSQGYLVRKLLPKFGDTKVAEMGLVLVIIGFGIASSTAIIVSPILLYVGVIILVIGDGLFEPSLSGLISGSVGPQMQGRVQGASQGMQSIARVIGPLFAAWLYQYWHGLPYSTEAVLVFFSLIVLISSRSIIHDHTTAR